MSGNAYAVAESQLGVAIETTRGTPVSPAYWLPIKAPKYKPDLTTMPDETLQGSMVGVYDLVPGLRYDSHGWDSYPYLDSFPVLMCALLGSTDTKTAAPTATTLSSPAAAGASSISTAATIAAGSIVTIGSGGTLETHITGTPTGAGPFTIPLLTPLIYAQASGNAVTGLTKHEFSLLNNAQSAGNQPPSLTVTDFDGEEWRQISAAQLDTLNIKGVATGLLDYTTSLMGNAAITPSAPSPSYTGSEAAPGWTTAVIVGGTQLGYVVDWEFDFKRGVKPIPTFTGSQQYFRYFAGVLQATAKLTVVEQSGAPELTQYLAGSTESLDFTTFDVQSGWAMNLHATKAKFKTGELVRSKEWVEAQLEVQLIPSSTDALAGGVSPIAATFGNAVTTAYH